MYTETHTLLFSSAPAAIAERYALYTMLDRLKKYGEAENQKAMQKARERGEIVMSGPYNIRNIPTIEGKKAACDNMIVKAKHFLDIADGGSGSKSAFESDLVRRTADKAFESWGEEEQQPARQDPGETVSKFTKAWGLVK